jgi:hypothetical protein
MRTCHASPAHCSSGSTDFHFSNDNNREISTVTVTAAFRISKDLTNVFSQTASVVQGLWDEQTCPHAPLPRCSFSDVEKDSRPMQRRNNILCQSIFCSMWLENPIYPAHNTRILMEVPKTLGGILSCRPLAKRAQAPGDTTILQYLIQETFGDEALISFLPPLMPDVSEGLV